METIRLKTHIGSDGLRCLEMPTDMKNVDAEVLVVYSIAQQAAPSDWAQFVAETYGSLADDPLERPAELPLDVRDEIE